MDTIFIDTNSIRNNKASSFFGNIKEYQKLSKQVQIIIPTIVIEEIKKQKRKFLKSQFDKFKSNYFSEYIGLDEKAFNDFNNHIDTKIEELYSKANNEFSHIELDLEEKDNLRKIKGLAIDNIAPFDTNTDKGFKDTYIYLTVLQYQKTASDGVFIITKDDRLKQAFKNNDITVLESADSYYIYYRDEYFVSDYFIGVLREYLGSDTISSDDIMDVSINEDSDWIVEVDFDSEAIYLLVDFYSKEIIDTL